MTSVPTPIHISFSQGEVDRMLALVKNHRLPASPIVPGASWDYGIDLEYMKALKQHWEENWSWETAQQEINRVPHFRAEVQGLDMHFIHLKSKREDAIPLLMSHGWPSSFLEFMSVIEPLANPTDDQPAFHVVVPSLPGFGFSAPPPKKKWTEYDVARVYNSIMVDALGYSRYAIVGGDWGTTINEVMVRQYPTHVLAAHFNMLLVKPPLLSPFGLLSLLKVPQSLALIGQSFVHDKQDLFGIERSENFQVTGMGYQGIQGTKPSTIGMALFDNPVGILAWIGEKFRDWSDTTNPSSNPSHIDFDHIITQAALYHLTGCIHTACLPYSDWTPTWYRPTSGSTPIGFSSFPYEITQAPRSWLESGRNLVYYNRHSFGGHFAAQDNPEAYIHDVREMMGKHFPR